LKKARIPDQINTYMSYGDHKLFLYENTIELAITTDGVCVDNRPMNNKRLVAHKGVTNEIYFTIRNRDRRLQNVVTQAIRMYIVDPETRKRLVTKTLEHGLDIGKVRLCLTEGDLIGIEPGMYHVYVTRSTTNEWDLPVYTNQNNDMRFDIDITDQTYSTPKLTQEQAETMQQTANVDQGDPANEFVSNTWTGNVQRNFPHATHTMALYADTYTGNVVVQGSCLMNVPDSAANSKDWFDIETIPLANVSSIANTTFQVNANWVRIKHYPESGILEKVLLRN